MKLRQGRERPEKILVAMFGLSKGTTKALKYEDVVVRAFKLFPDEFGLRGYPEYPDSSDVHKPLYGPLKKKGFVRAANKTFALTPRGVEIAQRLVEVAGHIVEKTGADRMTRDVQAEVSRMTGSDAFRLFINDQSDRILDTDFYTFLGCTVRTPKNDFLGRLSATQGAVEVASKLQQPDADAAKDLVAVSRYLEAQFSDIIKRRKGRA